MFQEHHDVFYTIGDTLTFWKKINLRFFCMSKFVETSIKMWGQYLMSLKNIVPKVYNTPQSNFI
jgi:hypothetical protein